jgi:1,4-alpha-glucan branching enzyme
MYRKGQRKGTAEFVIQASKEARQAFVAGDFSHWQPVAMKRREDGLFAVQVAAAPGPHEYKFIIDGQWAADPDHSNWARNPFGTMNSVATV